MDEENRQILTVLRRGVRRVIARNCPSVAEVPPEIGIQHHAHPMREIMFQLDGETNYMLDGKWYRAHVGDAFFIESMAEHGLYFSPCDRDLKQFWIGLYPRRLNIVFIALDHAGKIRHQLFYCSGNSAGYQILTNHWDSVRDDDHGDAKWHERLLRTALDLLLCDVGLSVLSGTSVSSQKKREDVVNFLFDYIDGNHGNDCALDKLEKLTGYSRYYLSHLYREYCGKTIGEAIDEARMRFVLSQDWHVSAKELAEMLGFTSSAIFWKWRKKHRDLEELLRREKKKRE